MIFGVLDGLVKLFQKNESNLSALMLSNIIAQPILASQNNPDERQCGFFVPNAETFCLDISTSRAS